MLIQTNVFSEDFILDITKIPGSSDDVILIAIDYYSKQAQNPNLAPILRDIARAFVGNLTEYYEMSNLNSPKLREALPHLSQSHRFMESKGSIDKDIESFGRIKSCYSVYQKILDKIFECIAKNEEIPEHNLLFDIYATRDIFYPRYDMKHNPEAFYRSTYKTIYEYMKYINALSKIDSRYGLVEQSQKTLKNLEKPKIITYNPNDISVPEHDFIHYALEAANIPVGYRYLPDLLDSLPIFTLKNEILNLKEYNLDDESDISKTLLYQKIYQNTQKEFQYRLRNYFEEFLLNKLSAKKNDGILKDYNSLPIEEFIEKHEISLSKFELDCCSFINYMDSYIDSDELSDINKLPEFQSSDFKNELSVTLDYYKDLQKRSVQNKLDIIKNLDLTNFEENLEEACNIRHYSRCCKDYMKYPNSRGYQSVHVLIRAPFGYYEKQIRTEEQHRFAEFGPASHTNTYKPDIKTTFHRLKIPRIFSPKRNSNGDIITPTELGILPLEQSIRFFYGAPFSNFSGGKTLEEFQAQYGTKEEFDKALLALSPVPKENKFIAKIRAFFTKKTSTYDYNNIPSLPKSNTDDVPKDIAAYSTDDTDPHDNR